MDGRVVLLQQALAAKRRLIVFTSAISPESCFKSNHFPGAPPITNCLTDSNSSPSVRRTIAGSPIAGLPPLNGAFVNLIYSSLSLSLVRSLTELAGLIDGWPMENFHSSGFCNLIFCSIVDTKAFNRMIAIER